MSGCFTRNSHHVRNRFLLKVWFQLAVYAGDRLNRNSTEEEKLIIQTILKSMQLG
ncbi:hypothetical protein [Lysinibacillus xylanilyticus]|uniref:hypothetical protein n=1 Tax=Lysinibacillus xylanilyticus TaxID=582475 RepID=UPI0036DDF1FA